MGVKMGVKTSDVGESSGKRNDSQEVQVVGETSKKKVDSYGCINFSPSLNSDTAESLEEIREDMCRKYNNQNPKDHDWEMIETQLRDTYSLQRYNINEGESVRDLLSKWPFLFTERGLFLHFKLLVGLDIRNTICEAFSKKAHRLNKFFKTEESGICKEADEIIKEAKAQSAKDSVIAWLPANILAIMKYFSEKEEQLFLTVDDTSTRAEVEAADTDGLPRIVCSGRSVMEAKKFRIVVDRVVVMSDLTSFITSLSALFALFYILNIQYQHGASATLEFIQRCFVGINPNRGSKSDRKRKSSCAGSVNAKVLRLINQMANFEWTTC
ncbi:uncharacterized protein LOC124291097 [Haliotis rubra]|uniref:uncharacterized protein LOC124291097 n=1 Tax=Haliotis rubra TaxID=36100 RepID=UPI001EE582EC|nr:uncharacterized protein LOC124291097 [Haliotis rubra]